MFMIFCIAFTEDTKKMRNCFRNLNKKRWTRKPKHKSAASEFIEFRNLSPSQRFLDGFQVHLDFLLTCVFWSKRIRHEFFVQFSLLSFALLPVATR